MGFSLKGEVMLLFFGALLMMVLSGFNYVLLNGVEHKFSLDYSGTLEAPYLLLAFLILTIARWGSFSKAFIGYFSLNALLLFAFTFLSGEQPPYGVRVWIYSAKLLPFILSWGFVNQNYQFKRAVIEYPLLWAGFSLPALLGKSLFLDATSSSLLICSLCSLLILTTYTFLNKVDLGSHEEGKKASWRYFIALVVIAFGMYFASIFPKVFSGFYSSKLVTLLLSSALCFLIGWVLKKCGPAYLSKLMGGITLGAMTLGVGLFYAPNLFIYMIFAVLVRAFIILKELFLFGVDRKNRFTVKMLADVIFFSLVPLFGGITEKSIGFQRGIFSYVVVFLIALSACLIALYITHQVLKKGLPKTK
jgi:hypothetical protein